MNDQTFTKNLRQDTPLNFDELVRQHETGVFNVAFRMLGNRQDAEDATQETFLRAYRFQERYDAQRPAAPWLKKIAAHVCLNRLEKRQPLPLEEDDERTLPSTDPLPETHSLERDLNREVRASLLSLPPRYRIIIELRHYQDLSYAEIAEEVGRPLSDVKSDLFRARQMLAQRLKDVT
jgi:RNA polymerase sigma-70 factor, ECF subfamily